MPINLQAPPLPTPTEMKQWDNAAIKLGIPEFTLMENAARAALNVLQRLKGCLANVPILLFMGSGNNGGDAAALARHLQDIGAKPLVLHIKNLSTYTGTCGKHTKLSKKLGIPFIQIPQKGEIILEKLVPPPWHKPHIIIDGLLGTGFKPPLRPQFLACIKLINSLDAFIFSLDIPSAYDTINHHIDDLAVKAHATICFAAAKPSLVLPQAKTYTGKLFVQKIGIPHTVTKQYPASFNLLSPKKIAKLLPTLPEQSHKGIWGHMLVIAGSKNLSGAAKLVAHAALRSGAGLVTVAAPSMLCTEIKTHLPELMSFELGEGYAWPHDLSANFVEKVASVSALAIGPGLGTEANTANFLKNILALPSRPRAVIDADALNILADNLHFLKLIRDDDILTPHPGEAARLLGISNKEVQNNRTETMHKLTTLAPCTWILKGAGALLAKGASPICILPYDIANLAIAGSGDVLTGCAAAFAAFKPPLPSFQAAAIAMTIHAYCGYITQQNFQRRGNMASDLIDLLPSAIASIADFPEVYDENI